MSVQHSDTVSLSDSDRDYLDVLLLEVQVRLVADAEGLRASRLASATQDLLRKWAERAADLRETLCKA